MAFFRITISPPNDEPYDADDVYFVPRQLFDVFARFYHSLRDAYHAEGQRLTYAIHRTSKAYVVTDPNYYMDATLPEPAETKFGNLAALL